jgi:predicted nuclease of predicted toxin-antitoxin system
MRFLVDANLPRSITAVLTRFGHSFEFVRDTALASAPDRVIAQRARDSGAALLTRDLGFADVRNYPPEEFPGIAVLRVPDDLTAADITQIVERFLREPQFLMHLSGRLAIVEPHRVRFRPALRQ